MVKKTTGCMPRKTFLELQEHSRKFQKPEPTVEELKALLAKAREALQLANDVMDYCGGDKWEREATAEDRSAFSKLYNEVMEGK